MSQNYRKRFYKDNTTLFRFLYNNTTNRLALISLIEKKTTKKNKQTSKVTVTVLTNIYYTAFYCEGII